MRTQITGATHEAAAVFVLSRYDGIQAGGVQSVRELINEQNHGQRAPSVVSSKASRPRRYKKKKKKKVPKPRC